MDRSTYGLFDLEDGVPTDAYSLEEAVRDDSLVPAPVRADFIDSRTLTPRGPDGLFKSAELDEPVLALDAVRSAALAA